MPVIHFQLCWICLCKYTCWCHVFFARTVATVWLYSTVSSCLEYPYPRRTQEIDFWRGVCEINTNPLICTSQGPSPIFLSFQKVARQPGRKMAEALVKRKHVYKIRKMDVDFLIWASFINCQHLWHNQLSSSSCSWAWSWWKQWAIIWLSGFLTQATGKGAGVLAFTLERRRVFSPFLRGSACLPESV